MKMTLKKSCAFGYKAFILSCIVAASVQADVTLPALIDHHMVIQRGVEFPVWGRASSS